MADEVTGSDRGVGVGRNVDKSTITPGDRNLAGNVVYNYPGDPPKRTDEERLDRVEASIATLQKTLHRVVSLVDGDASYRIIGIPDQLAAYIKASEDWKKATEMQINSHADRLKSLEGEGNRKIVIAPATAALLVVIGALSLVVAYFLLTWLQIAG